MMRPPRGLRRQYLLFALRVPRRWVKGFGECAGKGPVSSDKLLRMYRAQQKFLAHRHERRQTRRELRRGLNRGGEADVYQGCAPSNVQACS